MPAWRPDEPGGVAARPRRVDGLCEIPEERGMASAAARGELIVEVGDEEMAIAPRNHRSDDPPGPGRCSLGRGRHDDSSLGLRPRVMRTHVVYACPIAARP